MYRNHHPKLLRLNLSLCFFLLIGTSPLAIAAENDIWASLKNAEVVAVMRHAIAPGNGDPPEFEIGDCSTQRNLSQEGRQQAQSIGKEIEKHGITQLELFTSQWCRCVDTATEIGLSAADELPLLNSFYQDRSTAEMQTEQLRDWVKNRLNAGSANGSNVQQNIPALLVTHQVNITALTGVFPSSGEIVFLALKNGEPDVVTSLVVPH